MVLLAWIAIGLALSDAQAAEQRSIAFVGISGGSGFEAGQLATLEETFLAELGATNHFTRITGRSDVATLLGLERMQQLAGCDDSACLTELAGALGVELVGAADIGRVGDVTVLHFKVIEVKSAEVAARAMRKVASDAELLDAVADLAHDAVKLLRERAARKARLDAPPPSLALALVPFGVGQYANGSPVKGTLFLVAEGAAFATAALALSQFESMKLPGSGGVFEGGRFSDPAAAAQLQSTYLVAFWSGVALASIGVVDALVNR